MKNSLITTLVLLSAIFFSANAYASKTNRLKYDSLSCLKIEGKVNTNDETNEACIVELIGPNNTVDTISLTGGKKKFKFVLNKNTSYAIRVSKKGFISKVISVNTELIAHNDDIHAFEFETTLLKVEAIDKLNKDILDFPVAIIHFDYATDSFSYNKEYSNYIKKELHNVTQRSGDPKKDTYVSVHN